MKKVILILAICISSLLSEAQRDDQSDRDYLTTLFRNSGLVMTETRPDDELTPRCQRLNDPAFKLGYRTRIVDFDAKNGITLCDIYDSNKRKTGFTANTVSPVIIAKTNIELTENDLLSLRNRDTQREFSIIYNDFQAKGHLTLSKFIGAMMTLDPEIINFEETNATGLMTLRDGYSLSEVNGSEGAQQRINDSVASRFNQANLAYYSSLFSNMSEIYGYVQNLLFVFIGMFFIGKVGFDKGLRALDKSKESGGDTQWLAKFYIPVLSVGMFFAPIPEDNGMSATAVQKMIRFMAAESNAIADRASAVGVNTYVQRLYSTVGAMSAKGEQSIKMTQLSADAQVPIYELAVSDTNSVCKKRFQHISGSFLGVKINSASEERYKSLDINEIGGNSDINKQIEYQDIEFDTCRVMEYRMMVQNDINIKYSGYLASINDTYQNNTLKDLLRIVNEQLQDQQNKLGWTNAIIIPSVAILVESLPDVQNASSAMGITGATDLSSISRTINSPLLATITDQMNETLGAIRKENNLSEINMGETVGRLAFMALPGARGVYAALEKNREEADFIAKALNNKNVEDYVYSNRSKEAIITDKASEGIYLEATAKIYAWLVQKLPIVVSVIAGVIAFVGYVIELAKYFYVSPFVVAFALTTKKTHKIVDFLVTGLTIFFKPILMVIFIFFALFIYTLVQDIFLHYTANQFIVLGKIAGTHSSVYLVLNLLQTVMQVLGSLGATYIMWKLILTGPTWAMKMVGVDGAQNDMISEALSQRMDRAGFRM
jgi:hypothetical protein